MSAFACFYTACRSIVHVHLACSSPRKFKVSKNHPRKISSEVFLVKIPKIESVTNHTFMTLSNRLNSSSQLHLKGRRMQDMRRLVHLRLNMTHNDPLYVWHFVLHNRNRDTYQKHKDSIFKYVVNKASFMVAMESAALCVQQNA